MKLKKQLAISLASLLLAGTVTAEACTGVYIGSEVSADGTTIIARSVDAHPPLIPTFAEVLPAGKNPSLFREASNGFRYQLPEITYRTVILAITDGKNGQFDCTAMNEHGLAITATVTGYICPEAAKADPPVPNGILEEAIASTLGRSCKTAREAVEMAARIMDTKGSFENNICMFSDQKETWYMEMYTGHQYAAVKLPADKVAAFGNEFMLEDISAYPEAITSPELFSLPEKHGFAQYCENGNLNLADTYAGKDRLADYANLRTFRGREYFAPKNAGEYHTLTRYPLTYSPDEKIGLNKVIAFFRDQLEEPKYDANRASDKCRVVGTETSENVHVMKVHKDLPAAMALESWTAFSNAICCPFVPISNLTATFPNEYSTCRPAKATFDENSAACVYKELNTIGALNRQLIGKPLEAYWQNKENEWQHSWDKTRQQAADLYHAGKQDQAETILTATVNDIQRAALADARRLRNDARLYLMLNTDTFKSDFSYKTLTYTPHTYKPFDPK